MGLAEYVLFSSLVYSLFAIQIPYMKGEDG